MSTRLTKKNYFEIQQKNIYFVNKFQKIRLKKIKNKIPRKIRELRKSLKNNKKKTKIQKL
jgi:hypothetical protein